MYFQELDLDQTSPWRDPKNTVEYFYKTYGDPFYKWIEEYTNTYDPSIFDQHKDDMRVAYALNPSNPFFYRLAKIIYLYKEWNKYKEWKDPIIVRPMAVRNNKPLYIVNPGQDRWIVMQHFNVKSYNFLVLETEEFNPEHQKELESMWTKSTLEFRAVNDKWTLINTNKKFNTVIVLEEWFAQGSKSNIASPMSARDRALYNHKKRSG